MNQKLDFITKGLNFIGRFGFDTDNYNFIKRYKCPALWSADRFRKDDGTINFTRKRAEQEMTQTSGNTGERKSTLKPNSSITGILNPIFLAGH